jgi:hypothetical protein
MSPNPPNETDPLLPAPATTPTPDQRDGRISIKLCLLMIVTVIAASFGLFSLMFPITQCNDPADPLVRDRIRKEWSLELDQHEREKRRQESERDRWTNDEAVREQTRREWQHETERHDRQMEERRKQEEDDRQRLGISWSDLASRDQCLTHGSKEYTAQLLNVPAGYNLLKACMGTSVVIRDVVFERPVRCHVDHQYVSCHCSLLMASDMLALRGVTHGFWVVHNEPSCSTYWENFEDKVTHSSDSITDCR